MTCSHANNTVKDSRTTPEGSVRRRRLCLDCGYRWNTIEVTQDEYESLRALSEIAPAPEAVRQAWMNLGSLLGFEADTPVTSNGELIDRLKAAGVF